MPWAPISVRTCGQVPHLGEVEVVGEHEQDVRPLPSPGRGADRTHGATPATGGPRPRSRPGGARCATRTDTFGTRLAFSSPRTRNLPTRAARGAIRPGSGDEQKGTAGRGAGSRAGVHGGVRVRCRSVVQRERVARSKHQDMELTRPRAVRRPARPGRRPARAAILVLHGGKADSRAPGRVPPARPSGECSRSCAPLARSATISPSGSCGTATAAGTTSRRIPWPTSQFALDAIGAALRPGPGRARRPLDGRSRRVARRRAPIGARCRGARAVAARRRTGRAARRPRPRGAARHPRSDHEPAGVGPVRRPARALLARRTACVQRADRAGTACCCARVALAPAHRRRSSRPSSTTRRSPDALDDRAPPGASTATSARTDGARCSRRKVAVVGAGVAGLTAALPAAA